MSINATAVLRASRAHVSVAALTAALLPLGAFAAGPATAAPSCEPYCDDATSRVANTIGGRGHGAWVATTLDIGGYSGPRWAEITKIPAGHGKRDIGIIRVPKGKGAAARRALDGAWLVQQRSLFVLPLRSGTDTDGDVGAKHRKAARYAAKRLGAGWKIRRP